MKVVLLLLILNRLVSSSEPAEYTGQPLRIGECTISTPTSFILTPTPASLNNDVPSPNPTTFSYLYQGCDNAHPDCCPYTVDDNTVISSPIAQCPEDYATLSNPYNTTQSSLCCPIGWNIFPTPLPDIELYPCYNGSDDTGSYESSSPLKNEGSTNATDIEVLYVVLTISFELESPSVISKGKIIGVSIAGALFGCLLVTLWIMNRHMKRVKRRGAPVTIYKENKTKNWKLDAGEQERDGGEQPGNNMQKKGESVVSTEEVRL